MEERLIPDRACSEGLELDSQNIGAYRSLGE